MGIYHNDVSILSLKGEKLKRYLITESGLDFPLKDSLDTISMIFNWENWSEMFFAHQQNQQNITYWNNLRLHVKINTIKTRAIYVAKEVSCRLDLNSKQTNALADWLKREFTPKLVPLPKSMFKKRLPFNFWSGKSYRSLAPQHFKEGIKYINSSTLELTNHLKEVFLNDMGNPGCVVYCEPATTIDFARAFKKQGYEVTLFGKSLYLKNELDIEQKNIVFSSEYDKIKTDEFCSYYIQEIKRELVSKKYSQQISCFLDFYLELIKSRMGNFTFFEYLFVIPTLKEVVSIWKNDSPGHSVKLRELSNLVLNNCLVSLDKRDGNLTVNSEEIYHFTSSNITEQINRFIEYCKLSSFGDVPIWELRRPEVNQVYLFPTEHFQTSKMHASRINNIMMGVWGNDPLIHSVDDIFVFYHETKSDMGPTHNRDMDLKFKSHNQAKANILNYGNVVTSESAMDTQIVLHSNKWFVRSSKLNNKR